jgi:hypothetical protein
LKGKAFGKMLDKNKGKILAEVVFEEECCDGHSRETLMNLNKQYVRDHIFTPENILKQIDLQGGCSTIPKLNFKDWWRYWPAQMPKTKNDIDQFCHQNLKSSKQHKC